MRETKCITADSFKDAEAYWLDKLSGELNEIKILGDFPGSQTYEAGTIEFVLDGHLKDELVRISKNNDLSLYILLLSVLKILLFKYTEQTDIIAASPIYTPDNQEFNQYVVLRDVVTPDMAFKDLLMNIKETVVGAYKKEHLPLKNLIAFLDVPSVFSLYRIIILLENIHQKEWVGDLPADLAFSFRKTDEQLELDIRYNANLFRKETIEQVFLYYSRILSQVVHDTKKEIGEIELMTETERNTIVFLLNSTKKEYPNHKTIDQLFEEQAEQIPAKIAVVGNWQCTQYTVTLSREDKTREAVQLTYQELNKKSDNLAHLLIQKGVEPGIIVGIITNSSIEMVIGILGILKSGGAYLPIDPEYPLGRKRFMLRDSAARICMTHEELLEENRELLKDDSLENILIIGDETVDSTGTHGLTTRDRPNQLAYVIYTSGTTGNPKGVLVEHRGVVNYTCCRLDTYRYTEKDRTLQLLTYSFDGFGSNFFSSLLSGGILFMVPDSRKMDFNYIRDTINTMGITNTSLVPGMFRAILDVSRESDNQSLRFVVLAGEKADDDLIRMSKEKNPHILLINEYGPTETTVTAAVKLGMEEGNTAVIGTPISNIQAYILDCSLNHMPQNIQGELCISGIGVSRGYLNRPELNAEKFFPDPFIPGERMYRTGDLARRRTDGNIEFLGRKDDQIKVRGFRIELEEIERQLLNHEAIKEAVVLSKKIISGELTLCAYIVSEGQGKPETSELKEYLSRNLPYYMVPLYFIHMEKIPLTMNGKIDKKGLPDPEIGMKDVYVAPRDEDEERLSEIWSEVLKIEKDKIGIYNNFFELGGHSLMATVLAARIHKAFHVDIKLVKIFELPTISQLIDYIKRASKDMFVSIETLEKNEYYELSSAQKRLYLIQQMDQENTAYNMPAVILLPGPPDIVKLEAIFRKLINRHESLRTSFHMIGDEPFQRIHDNVEFEIDHYDLTAKTREDTRRENEIHHSNQHQLFIEKIHHFVRPFDLSQAPLLRIGLIRTGDGTFRLMKDMHHIISDAVSLEVLREEFQALYENKELPGLRLQYKDYAEWQNSLEQQGKIKKQKAYWLEELSEELPMLNLPGAYKRPVIKSFEGNSVDFILSEEETGRLKRLAKERDTTLFMVILTIYNILLGKLSGQEDIIIGTAIAARRHADLQRIIGMFVNMLAMRNFPSGEKTFGEFLNEVKIRTLEAFENQEYQFEDLVDKLCAERDTSRNPIFDAAFNLSDMSVSEYTADYLDGKKNEEYSLERSVSKFDLTLTAIDWGESLHFSFEYCTKLFQSAAIERFIRYFRKIISEVTVTINQKISDIEIISEQEKEQLLYTFNDTVSDYPAHKSIHELFEEQVKKVPDRMAVVGKGEKTGEPIQLTYRELNERSNRLAFQLFQKGIQSDTIVGIMMERSSEMIIGMLAILKAGGAYLSIDPQYPEERNQYILADSNATLLLTTRSFIETIDFKKEIIYLDDYKEIKGIHHSSDQFIIQHSSSIAYIIYTSGSTGKPRGVMIEHIGIANLSAFHRKSFKVNETDRVVQFASSSYDASVWEIYMALLNGAALYIPGRDVIGDYERFEEYMQKNQVTTATLPPFYASQLNPGQLKSLQRLITAGSAPSSGFVDKWRGRVKYMNAYGPTETTICATVWEAGEEIYDRPVIPIGKPIINTYAYILDANLNIQPIGVPGELCTAGVGTGRGYLNRPELTAEKFDQDFWDYQDYQDEKEKSEGPHHSSFIAPTHHLALYRTGDLARWLHDGNIEFLGRIDHQVKIRGCRIELGEIESQLLNINEIKDAVVMAKEEGKGKGETYLCAYIVTLESASIDLSEIKKILSKNLPDYMIPSCFVQVKEIPLTSNGKINRKALPEPELVKSENYTAPRNEIERKLVNIWSDVLNVDKDVISIDSNFFELGGHSLKAAILTSRVYKELNVKIPLVEIFRTSTVSGLSEYIKSSRQDKYASIDPVEEKEYYELSSAQKRLYISQQMEPGSTAYNLPAVIWLEGELERGNLEGAILEMINRHESFRTSFQVINRKIFQKIEEPGAMDFVLTYYEAHEEESRPIIKQFSRPFDLSKAPLIRVGLIKIDRKKYILMVDSHHIISDGTSKDIFLNDLIRLYKGEELPTLRLQYKDFSQWKNSKGEMEAVRQQEEYWKKQFEGELPLLELPGDYQRPPVKSFEGSILSFEIGPEETNGLKELALAENATLYMLLLALYYVLLWELTGNSDIVVGTGALGRNHPDLMPIIGMFVNTLALRNYPKGEMPFIDFLKEVRKNTLDAFANQDYQFEDLVGHVMETRYPDRNPLFDVGFLLQNLESTAVEIPNLKLTPFFHEMNTTKFDMSMAAVEAGDKLDFTIQYTTKIFKQETIQLFIGYFKEIVSSVLENKVIKLKDITISHDLEDSESDVLEIDFGFFETGDTN